MRFSLLYYFFSFSCYLLLLRGCLIVADCSLCLWFVLVWLGFILSCRPAGEGGVIFPFWWVLMWSTTVPTQFLRRLFRVVVLYISVRWCSGFGVGWWWICGFRGLKWMGRFWGRGHAGMCIHMYDEDDDEEDNDTMRMRMRVAMRGGVCIQ
jgi:hypothetical protein